MKVDRRKGAVIAVDMDRAREEDRIEKELRVILASALCRGLSRSDLHRMIDRICDAYDKEEA